MRGPTPRQLLLLCTLAGWSGCQCGASSLEVTPRTLDFGLVAPGEVRLEEATVVTKGPPTSVQVRLDPSFGTPGAFSRTTDETVRVGTSPGSVGFRVTAPVDGLAATLSARAVLEADDVSVDLFLVASVAPRTPQPDGGRQDAGAPAAGSGDAGTVDAGEADAGPQDAGEVDAGTADASVADAGGQDGGARDAGSTDAGALADAGTDGGLPDAGRMDAGNSCATACTSWTQCSEPGTGCDTSRGCCVPCGRAGQPCCVDWAAGQFFCGDGGSALVCGRSSGSSSTTGYFCCPNAGDGCCQQGGCGGGTCCKCPRNGLNFCVQPAFGCGGC